MLQGLDCIEIAIPFVTKGRAGTEFVESLGFSALTTFLSAAAAEGTAAGTTFLVCFFFLVTFLEGATELVETIGTGTSEIAGGGTGAAEAGVLVLVATCAKALPHIKAAKIKPNFIFIK